MVASVRSSTLATETAFSSPIRTTLVGSMMPASTQVDRHPRGSHRNRNCLSLRPSWRPPRRRRRPSSRRSGGPEPRAPASRSGTPVRSSPSHRFSSSATASMQRRSARPPPGTTPSATPALVALIASSSASFFDFISASVGALIYDSDTSGELGEPLLAFRDHSRPLCCRSRGGSVRHGP